MITERNTTVLASKYEPTKNMKKFIEKCTGAKLTPVKGKEDAFWISGDKRGNYYEQKYYKIVFGFLYPESFISNGLKSFSLTSWSKSKPVAFSITADKV